MDRSGILFLFVLMGSLCALFAYLLVKAVRTTEVGSRGALRWLRIVVFGLGAVLFGYVFVNMLLVLPQILSGSLGL